MKLERAEQRDKEGAAAGKETSWWQKKASGYAKQEADAQKKLTRAEASEAAVVERRQKRESALAQRREVAERAESEARLARTERAVWSVALGGSASPRRDDIRCPRSHEITHDITGPAVPSGPILQWIIPETC